MLLDAVVDAAARSGVIRIPEPFRVPVGFGEVAADHKALLAVGIEHLLSHVLARIVGKRTVGNREIGVLGGEHAESVVVLGGKDYAFHARSHEGACPLLAVEACGIESLGV